jgi:hypothetical protein
MLLMVIFIQKSDADKFIPPKIILRFLIKEKYKD